MASSTWAEILETAESGGVIPDGIYESVVEAAEYKLSSTSKPMVVAVFKVTSGPHAGAEIYNNFVFQPTKPKSLGFFMDHMGALGWTKDAILALPNPPEGLANLAAGIVGRAAQITVGHREWQGKTYNQINTITPSGGVPAVAPAPAPVAPAPEVAQPQPAAGQAPAGPGSIQPPAVPPAAPPAPTAPPTAPPF